MPFPGRCIRARHPACVRGQGGKGLRHRSSGGLPWVWTCRSHSRTRGPRSLQLPLYALDDPEVAGIAYAQLRADDLAWRGIMDGDRGEAPFKAAEIPWPEQLAAWRDTAEALAGAFGRGEAAVDPARYACTYCDLAMLCRIRNQAGADDD